MIVNRRNFLIGFGTALATPAIIRVSSLDRVRGFIAPTLHGDDLHDDTRALNAFGSGKPFWHEDRLVSAADLRGCLPGGRYRLADTFVVGIDRVTVADSTFTATRPMPFLIRVDKANNTSLSGVNLCSRFQREAALFVS